MVEYKHLLIGTAIYKVLARIDNGHTLTFRKVNSEEEIFRVDNTTGVVTVEATPTQGITYTIHIIIEDQEKEHMKLALVVVKVEPPQDQTQRLDMTFDVYQERVPTILAIGNGPTPPGVLTRIVYGNTWVEQMETDEIATIDEESGEMTLVQVPCIGTHELFVGLYTRNNSLQTVLQRVTLRMNGRELEVCSPATNVTLQCPTVTGGQCTLPFYEGKEKICNLKYKEDF